MAASLDYDPANGGTLSVKIGGLDSEDFAHALNVVKSITGRRFNPETKDWEWSADYMTATKIINMLGPVPSPAALVFLHAAKQEQADAVRTKLPDDAELLLPWAGRLYSFQRAGVARMVQHPRIILADDLGTGKTVQTLGAIAENLLQFECEKNELERSGGRAAVYAALEREQSRAGEGIERPQHEETSSGDTNTDRREESIRVRGLWEHLAAAVYGHGSRPRGSTVFDSALGACQSALRHDAQATSDSGASQVRSALPELPSLATLPRLVVCPNSLVQNWHDEIKKWTNEDAFIAAGLPSAKRKRQIEKAVSEGRTLVINWEALRVTPQLADVRWLSITADEAHRAKNRKAKQTRALWKLQAPIKLAATGTPIMNSPDELYPLLKWLYPKIYTSYWRFYMNYCDFVETHYGRQKGRVVTGVKNVDALRFELSDKLIRRTKREVLPDLPEKLRPQIVPVEMPPKQRRLYEEAENELWLKVEQEVREGTLDPEVLQNPERLFLLPNAAARTTRLRQVASTPALLGGPDVSGKLDACVEYIRDMDADRKAVIFTEFTDTADILVQRLAKVKIDAAAFHGKVDRATRDGLKHAFQNEPDPRVLVCTPETGGVGLTLTAANVAGFIEEDWVPANNTQAEDRLHRIGQTREVHVIVWRAINSVDTKRVAPTLVRKDRIVSAVVKQDQEVPDVGSND
jgi:SNF2 family DNA or RNA helicase